MITQAPYPVYNVNDTSSSSAVECLGSKFKEWRIYEVAGKLILQVIEPDEVRSVFGRVDEHFITEPAKEFAIAILYENMKRLREILV